MTHIDTPDHNVHNQPGIAPLVLEFARRLGVPAVRVLKNTTTGPSLRNRLSVRFFNGRLCVVQGWRGRCISAQLGQPIARSRHGVPGRASSTTSRW